MSKATYAKRMADGLCADCGGPKPSLNVCRCVPCTQKQREGKARYNRGLWVASEREELAADKSPRCRCGLRLSTPGELASGACSSCIPSAREMAESRRYAE